LLLYPASLSFPTRRSSDLLSTRPLAPRERTLHPVRQGNLPAHWSAVRGVLVPIVLPLLPNRRRSQACRAAPSTETNVATHLAVLAELELRGTRVDPSSCSES